MAKQLCLVCASPTDEELQRVTGKTHDEDEDCSAIDKYFAERDKWIDANLSGIKFGEVIADEYGVIVAIGDNIQASILTTIMLKELGVKKVTVKAQNDYHEKVLVKIGADHVVHPERDMGRRIANNIVSNSVLDYLELSDEHSIVEIVANHRIDRHSIINLDVRAKYGINIVAIKRRDEIIVSPQASEIIYENDILIVIGADVDINRFEKKMLS